MLKKDLVLPFMLSTVFSGIAHTHTQKSNINLSSAELVSNETLGPLYAAICQPMFGTFSDMREMVM